MLELVKDHYVLTFIFAVLCLDVIDTCVKAIANAIGSRQR